MEAVEAVRNAVESHHVLITGQVVSDWLRSASRAQLAREMSEQMDPEGTHVAHQMIFHNDREWRVMVQCKMRGTDEPRDVIVDVSMEDWSRAESATKALLLRMERDAT